MHPMRECRCPAELCRRRPFCPNCQGLDFSDQDGDNEALVTAIVKANAPGFYVFSAPWETISALMANINKLEGYNLSSSGELYQSQLYLCDFDHAVGKRQPGHLRQPPDPAFHLPGVAPAAAGQRCLQRRRRISASP